MPRPPLQVGQPFQKGRRSWPPGIFYGFRHGRHELLVCLSPGAGDLEAFQAGPLDLGLVVDGPAILLTHKLEGIADDWAVAAFSWFLERPADRKLPPDEAPGEPIPLEMVLVNPVTGLVLALRTVRLPADFAAALHEAIRKQAAAQWPGNAGFDRHLDRLLSRETAEDLYLRATARCRAEG